MLSCEAAFKRYMNAAIPADAAPVGGDDLIIIRQTFYTGYACAMRLVADVLNYDDKKILLELLQNVRIELEAYNAALVEEGQKKNQRTRRFGV